MADPQKTLAAAATADERAALEEWLNNCAKHGPNPTELTTIDLWLEGYRARRSDVVEQAAMMMAAAASDLPWIERNETEKARWRSLAATVVMMARNG